MIRKIKRGIVLLLMVLSVMGLPLEALAATKPINSVSVKVSSKLEPGTHLPDIQIDGR